ncbi:hypothetical protein SDC9_87666 [bioreactor metagenome]|uniref:Uncharacterized protein n=1 Tax=bioreactor metagenome TaxID=1076179 RepID=A0A644ZJW0_9ZZZZ
MRINGREGIEKVIAICGNRGCPFIEPGIDFRLQNLRLHPAALIVSGDNENIVVLHPRDVTDRITPSILARRGDIKHGIVFSKRRTELSAVRVEQVHPFYYITRRRFLFLHRILHPLQSTYSQ